MLPENGELHEGYAAGADEKQEESPMRKELSVQRDTVEEEHRWRLDLILTLLELGLPSPWPATLVRLAVGGGDAVVHVVGAMVGRAFGDRLAVGEHALSLFNRESNAWLQSRIESVQGAGDDMPGYYRVATLHDDHTLSQLLPPTRVLPVGAGGAGALLVTNLHTNPTLPPATPPHPSHSRPSPTPLHHGPPYPTPPHSF